MPPIFNAYEIAKEIVSIGDIITRSVTHNMAYWYNEKTGYWNDINFFRYLIRKKVGVEPGRPLFTMQTDQITREIMRLTYDPDFDKKFNSTHLIKFRDKVIDLSNGNIVVRNPCKTDYCTDDTNYKQWPIDEMYNNNFGKIQTYFLNMFPEKHDYAIDVLHELICRHNQDHNPKYLIVRFVGGYGKSYLARTLYEIDRRMGFISFSDTDPMDTGLLTVVGEAPTYFYGEYKGFQMEVTGVTGGKKHKKHENIVPINVILIGKDELVIHDRGNSCKQHTLEFDKNLKIDPTYELPAPELIFRYILEGGQKVEENIGLTVTI